MSDYIDMDGIIYSERCSPTLASFKVNMLNLHIPRVPVSNQASSVRVSVQQRLWLIYN